MSYGRIVTVAAALALVLTACGSDADAPTSTEAAGAATLDSAACANLTDANLDLATATSGEQARAAAGVFGEYSPPADVQDAVDHIVEAGGVKFDGPDFDLVTDHIDPWVREVCPE